jgi:uncharacterized pyridoxamine 5'-phosphate oxidase family protein
MSNRERFHRTGCASGLKGRAGFPNQPQTPLRPCDGFGETALPRAQRKAVAKHIKTAPQPRRLARTALYRHSGLLDIRPCAKIQPFAEEGTRPTAGSRRCCTDYRLAGNGKKERIMKKAIALAVLLPVLAGMGDEVKSYVLLKDGADKQDAFLQDVATFLEKAGHFYLATVDEDGGARVRPIKYTLIIDNKLIFATSNTKELFKHIEKNPKVEISNTLPDGSAYLRYKGTAKLTTDEAVKAHFLSAFPKFKDMYKEGLAFFFIEPEMAGIFPMKGGKPKTKQFAGAGVR